MQPMRKLSHWLEHHASEEHYLFSLQDLRSLCPELSENAFKTLLSRTVQAGLLTRICRGLYTYRKAIPPSGLVLFHAAAHVRPDHFNYISLETVLSEAGVISQIPLNTVFIMSSGRSNTIACGEFGTIEFIHTTQKPTDIMEHLTYDNARKMWRASVAQALRDMKATHRNSDLIDWDTANELI